MRKFFSLWFIVISTLFATDATLEIVKKVETLPTFKIVAQQQNRSLVAQQFARYITNDINVLAHFNVQDNSMAQTDFSLRYQIAPTLDNQVEIHVQLTNKLEKPVLDKSYVVKTKDHLIFLVHQVAIDINNYFGAPSVDWMKKYILFARYSGSKQSDIYIADYTLTYQKKIVSGGLNIFPQWANASQDSFYFTHYDDKPTLYRMDLKSGMRTRITQSEGMLVCSDVTDDGRYLLLTMAPDGQPDIYRYDTTKQNIERLTYFKGIDVNGQFIDNNKRITFVSDRLGYPNIYAKTIGANSVEQMVFYGRNNNSCSSHDNYIVYTSRESNEAFGRNTFNLHLISTRTDFIRRLTANGVNQFPKFSPDGDSIVFIKNIGRESSVGIIRLKYNKTFLFPLLGGKIQSLDW
jgi:TolB protein